MADIHAAVEAKRGKAIPDWAYRDVLFMLIDYSIRAYEVLERPLTLDEKREVFAVFHRVGTRMGVRGLPANLPHWMHMRRQHLQENMVHSAYTTDLFRQYRRHLGLPRYLMLREGQKLVVPAAVRRMLGYSGRSLLRPVLGIYKLLRSVGVHHLMRDIILPAAYREEIQSLDQPPLPPSRGRCPVAAVNP